MLSSSSASQTEEQTEMDDYETPEEGLDFYRSTVYDNEVTLLYKYANLKQVSTRLMIVRKRSPREEFDPVNDDGTLKVVYESAQQTLTRLLNKDKNLRYIHYYLKKYNPNLTDKDIAMLYYSVLRDKQRNNEILPTERLFPFINEYYTDINEEIENDHYDDEQSLRREYSVWKDLVDKSMIEEAERLETIVHVQAELAQVEYDRENPDDDEEDETPNPPFGNLVMKSTVSSFSPTYLGREPTIEDGSDIFNSCEVSQYVPFVRYNDSNGRSYFRVFTGSRTENAPNYSHTILNSMKAPKENAIYMTLWLGDPNNDGSAKISKASQDSFSKVSYYIETNKLVIKSPISSKKKSLIDNEEVAHARVQAACKNLIFGRGEEVKVGGSFDIWDMQFEETSFAHLMLLDPVMRVYLYIEENSKPFAMKKRMDIHYRSIYSDHNEGSKERDDAYIANSASVTLTLNQKITTVPTTVNLIDPVTSEIIGMQEVPIGTYYLHINISRANSREVVQEFMPIFSLLMSYYLKLSPAIMEEYYITYPELRELADLVQNRKIKDFSLQNDGRRNSGKKSKLGKRKEGYLRDCQGDRQPEAVTDEEAAEWVKTINPRTRKPNQVLKFPAADPKFNFICRSDSNPYPGVQAGTPENPYEPCCFKRDKMNSKTGKFADYLAGVPYVERKGAKADKTITTKKILSPFKTGELPDNVESLLNGYSPNHHHMLRYGVLYSANSFLHSICVAIDDEQYFDCPTDEDKETYVREIRQYMLQTCNTSVMKQELYDYSEDDIIRELSDNDLFFDPSLFYRIVEETFGINVYVFSPPMGSNEQEKGNFSVPRCKIFHSRPIRLYRPTIIIIQSFGSESNSLIYPQCELAIDYNSRAKEIIKVFGEDMTKLCHDTLQNTIKTVNWDITSTGMFDVHSNLYYHMDHLQLFTKNNVKPISQFLDRNGKMRAIHLLLNNGMKMTVATVPSQPENLPVKNKVYRVPIDIISDVFSTEPSGYSISNSNIDGVWFSALGVQFAEYVPIEPFEMEDLDRPIGPDNPLQNIGISLTTRVIRLRKTLNVIVQLVRWLYILATNREDITAEDFVTRYFDVNTRPVLDSSTYYDVSRINRNLPIVENIADAMDEIERKSTGLIIRRKIVMYDDVFANRMYRMLKDYHNLRSELVIPTSISKFYVTEEDFIQVPNSKIFVNEEDLNAWLLTLKSSVNYSNFFNIRQKIDPDSLSKTLDPYLYQDDDGKIYIIQNTIGGARDRAGFVANAWYKYSINVGSNPIPENGHTLIVGSDQNADGYMDITDISRPDSEDRLPEGSIHIHMLYGISAAGKLIPIEDNTDGSPEYINIVYYGTHSEYIVRDGKGIYGAILEIL